jgi:RNA polymerase sigma-70 factor (ECF subfamily)
VSDRRLDTDQDFVDFLRPHLEEARRALAARFGTEVGAEVAADVQVWAWEHRGLLEQAGNPSGYLFRVGQSRARKYLRWRRLTPAAERRVPDEAAADPALHEALQKLAETQRTVVVLVHGFGLSYADTATQLGLSEGAVRNQLHRAMTRLRAQLEAEVKT